MIQLQKMALQSFLLTIFVLTSLLQWGCNDSTTKPADKEADKEHFPVDAAANAQILEILNQYPQIEEFGYVFKDYEFLNEHLIVFDKKEMSDMGVIVNWIDYKTRKYVDDDFFTEYYLNVVRKLNINQGDFEKLRKLMTANYIEGVINEKERKYLFLNKPMGTFKGYVYAADGRKGVGESIFINDINLRVIEQFDDNWFGFIYP